MKNDWVLTQDVFDALLVWLGPDRDQAGRKYEDIRVRLIKIFTCRGCSVAEELADETINRVSAKHHKLLVIDFDKPTARVYMGSYNFSDAAYTKELCLKTLGMQLKELVNAGSADVLVRNARCTLRFVRKSGSRIVRAARSVRTGTSALPASGTPSLSRQSHETDNSEQRAISAS